MKIGQKLKGLRVKSGLSQEKVAEQLYVSRQAISKWENDEAFPDMANLVAIAKFYNVSVDYILSEDEEKSNPQNTNMTPDATSEMSEWNKRYLTARISLIVVTVITFINYILKLCGIFSFSLPFGAGMPSTIIRYATEQSGRSPEFNDKLEQIGAHINEISDPTYYFLIVVASLIVIGYSISALFSGKPNGEMMIIGLLLWTGETLYSFLMILLANIMSIISDGKLYFPDSFMHYVNQIWYIVFIVFLVRGISSASKMITAEKMKKKEL